MNIISESLPTAMTPSSKDSRISSLTLYIAEKTSGSNPMRLSLTFFDIFMEIRNSAALARMIMPRKISSTLRFLSFMLDISIRVMTKPDASPFSPSMTA